MTDLHTHLLPAVDDGARSVTESLELVKKLRRIGFDSFVFTPHFYSYKETYSSFIRRRDTAFKGFKRLFPDTDIRIGCECYMHSNLFAIEDITSLCIKGEDGKKYILVELSYSNREAQHMFELCQRLIKIYDVVPILAHIERCPYIMKNEEYAKDLIKMGCKFQVNIGSFSRYFIRKRLAEYMEKGYISFLGSDTHRLPFETERFAKAQVFLYENFGKDWQSMFERI